MVMPAIAPSPVLTTIHFSGVLVSALVLTLTGKLIHSQMFSLIWAAPAFRLILMPVNAQPKRENIRRVNLFLLTALNHLVSSQWAILTLSQLLTVMITLLVFPPRSPSRPPTPTSRLNDPYLNQSILFYKLYYFYPIKPFSVTRINENYYMFQYNKIDRVSSSMIECKKHYRYISNINVQFIAAYYFFFPSCNKVKKQMGTCTASTKQSLREKIQAFDASPSDTDSFKNITLPILAFYVLISDIKIKKCTYDFIYLKFKIDGIHEYQTPLREIDRSSKAYWKISHAFEFYMTEYLLRGKFLVIEAYNNHDKFIGSLKLNMFVLWVGPYHLDFKFELPKAQNCRISLNFKISQGLHLTIDNLSTQMIPSEPKFLQDRFTYTIEAIIGQQLQASTCPYIVRIKEMADNVKEEKCILETYHVTNDKIIWKQEVGKELLLPKFDRKIAYYQIYSSSLHLIFFRVLPGFQQKNELRYDIESECFISLAKLMTLDYIIRKDPITNITYYERKVELVEKTWLHGTEMGKVKITFKFTLQSHLKQMQACVRTEKGILTSSPVFNQNANQSRACEEIQALKLISNDVQKQFINLDQNSGAKNNFIMIKENILRIVNLLTKELALLEKSSKESILFYEYKNELQLYKAQRFLIDLAFKSAAYIHDDKPEICQACWNILTVIIKRGEFKLSHIGFSKFDKEKIQSKNIDETLSNKIEAALKYQELLNHLLNETLNLLEYKGEQAEQIFAESFCSYAYFRIPLFREHILSVIHRQEDPVIREWRGTEVNLYQDLSQTSASKSDDFYDNLFDWENNFYKPLQFQEKFKLNHIQLQSILLEDKWRNRLAKRSGAFYTFFQNLVKEIEYVSVVSKYIKWHHMPGYNKLLHAFLVQMKNTKIKNYTDRFKKCCTKLLANEKLLNIFVMILLSNTNINDPDTVQITFEMIDGFLTSIKKNLRFIPGTFDYKYFLQGMKMVLNSQLSFSISQVLLLIYNHLSTFSQEFGLQVSLFLLSKPFFRYFFNWSYNIRHIFQTLLYVKISKISQQNSTVGNSPQKASQQWSYVTNMKTSVHQRYISLMEMIQKQIEPQLKSTNENRFYEKTLYKKMKVKLQIGRRNKGKKSQRRQSIKIVSINEIPLPDIRSVKSLSNTGPMITPYKMIYFKENEMNTNTPTNKQLSYAKDALAEYHALVEDIKKNQKLDPKFLPEMKIKKLMDEKELGPIIVDQW